MTSVAIAAMTTERPSATPNSRNSTVRMMNDVSTNPSQFTATM